MRGILLTLIVAGLIPLIFRRPEYGAYAWAWISIMNPHTLTFGFAQSIPFALVIAVVTVASFLFSARKNPLPINGGTVLLMLLVFWMTVTSFFSINDPTIVWDRLIFVTKMHLMLLVTLTLVRGRKQIDVLIWVIVISLGFYGVNGGIYTIVTAGGGRVWGPPGGMLAGNNELAVGLILVLPLMYYLYQTATRRWIRWTMLAAIVLMAFGILGSQSRGALVGLLAGAFLLGLKSKYPIRSSLALAALLVCAIAFMPATWTERMDTIQGYEGDSSAMSRIWTWNTLWNVAVDRPLVGAGFGAENPMIFVTYAPTGGQFEVFQGKFWVAHSIYFQALGEHGFPGLMIYLSLGFWTWWAAGRVAKRARGNPAMADWVPILMRMCQASLLGFAAGGAFLSLMNLDVPYYLMAIVTLTQLAVRQAEVDAVPGPESVDISDRSEVSGNSRRVDAASAPV